jgi:hypothetical protein
VLYLLEIVTTGRHTCRIATLRQQIERIHFPGGHIVKREGGWTALVIAIVGAFWLFGSASYAQDAAKYTARLAPVPIDAAGLATVSGIGSAVAELTGTKLSITGTFERLRSPATVARVHKGPKGISGSPVFDLTVSKATSGTVSGTIELSAAQIRDLKEGRLYVQIHSERAPDGNLRGWLLPEERRK